MKSLFRKPDPTDLPKWPALPLLLRGPAREAFLVSTFSLLGRIGSCNGKLDRKCQAVIREFSRQRLNLKEEEELIGLKVFQKASHGVGDIERQAERFHDAMGGKPKYLSALVDTLIHVALLDGDISPAEREVIETVCAAFQIPFEEFERLQSDRVKAKETATLLREELEQQQTEAQRRIRNKHKETSTSVVDRSYVVLGLSVTDDVATIKRTYQRLVFEKHPDRMARKEKNEQKLREAREDFQRILQAYNHIRREKKF